MKKPDITELQRAKFRMATEADFAFFVATTFVGVVEGANKGDGSIVIQTWKKAALANVRSAGDKDPERAALYLAGSEQAISDVARSVRKTLKF